MLQGWIRIKIKNAYVIYEWSLSATAAVVKTSNSNSISNLTSEVEAEAETPRISKQIDRTDALLGGFNTADASELPLHEPTGEKTRKTYDFTSMYSCDKITMN